MRRIAICAQPRQLARLSAALTKRGYQVHARASSAADLLAALAASSREDDPVVVAVIADAGRKCLTAELIGHCDRRGIRLVAVAAGSRGRRRAARLGLFEVVDMTEGADAVAHMVSAPILSRSTLSGAEGTSGGSTRGRVIAVWGANGAPGRSSIATALAGEYAQRGVEVALGDVDPYGGSIATALGLLDEAPGFAAACRLAGNADLTVSELDRLATEYPARRGRLKVLTGITQPARWPELAEERVTEVIERLRDWSEVSVLDLGFSVEADEELSSDVFAPRRNAATIASLRAADQVVIVGSADPVGISRLVRARSDLAQLLPGVSPTVVVNRVRGRTTTVGHAYQVRAALERFGGITAPVLIPDDPRAFDRAVFAGRTLVDAAPHSPARAAVRRLADLLAPAATALPARRVPQTSVLRHSSPAAEATVDWQRADAQ